MSTNWWMNSCIVCNIYTLLLPSIHSNLQLKLQVSSFFISLINPLGVMRLSASWCHFRQCAWDLGSAWAERPGQGVVGACTRRGQTAWLCLGSSLQVTWLAMGGPFLSFWLRDKWSHPVGPQFPEFKARFSAMAGWHFSRDLTKRLLIGGCGHSHVSVRYGWNYLREQFWA